VLDVTVIDDAAAAEAALDPARARILTALAAGPASASSLAPHVGLTRQQATYHLRTLEKHGLVALHEERARGGLVERLYATTAAAYVISPAALPGVAPDPSRLPDQRSARWLLSLAAQLVRDVGTLLTRSQAAGNPVATFALDGEIAFASATDRAAFVGDLTAAVDRLVAHYHRPSPSGARAHRLVLALHPSITKEH
jgi:DNA-binding transcriptional ArsR family regulator